MPVTVLYLSTTSASPTWNQGVPVDKTNLNNVKWNLNWDDIFRGENNNYKYCRVRVKLLSSSWTGVSTDWDTYLGYLTCNLQSMTSGFSTYGTVLSETQAADCPTTGTTTHCMILNTTQEPGVDVIMPKGNQDFYLTFNRMDLSNGARISNIYDYQVFLYFELYDRI
jgi:hypothetical protein